MRSRRRNIKNGGGGPPATIVLNLSLFIMLLAFFIVLNTMSSFEEIKVKPIISSLEKAFSTDVRRQDVLPSVTPEIENPNIDEGNILRRLEALFQSQIAAYEATSSDRRGIMHVRVPTDILTKAVLSVEAQTSGETDEGVLDESEAFLEMLVSILRSEEMGIVYRLDIVTNVDGNPAALQNEIPQAMFSVMAQVSLLTQKLEQAGMSEHLLSSGLKQGDPAYIDLYFSPHEPFNPLGDSDQGAQ